MEEAIKLLSEKLDVSTEFVYQAMMQQVYIARALDVVYVALYIAFMFWYASFARRTHPAWTDLDSPIWIMIFALVGGICAAFFTMVFLASLEGMITVWVNPDAWIIDRLLSRLK